MSFEIPFMPRRKVKAVFDWLGVLVVNALLALMLLAAIAFPIAMLMQGAIWLAAGYVSAILIMLLYEYGKDK